MARPVTDIVTHEVVPIIRAALTETAELRGAVQVLADRVEALTAELMEGELLELRKLAGSALRLLETIHEGGEP